MVIPNAPLYSNLNKYLSLITLPYPLWFHISAALYSKAFMISCLNGLSPLPPLSLQHVLHPLLPSKLVFFMFFNNRHDVTSKYHSSASVYLLCTIKHAAYFLFFDNLLNFMKPLSLLVFFLPAWILSFDLVMGSSSSKHLYRLTCSRLVLCILFSSFCTFSKKLLINLHSLKYIQLFLCQSHLTNVA